MASNVNILVTGAAGFIGWKVCEFLLTKPELIPNEIITQSPNNPMTINVIGIDNMNDYYDVRLKQWRLDQLKKLNRHCEESSDEAIWHNRFHFHKLDIEDYSALKKLFEQYSKSPVHPDSGTQPSVIASEAKQSQEGRRSPFIAVINLAARAGVRYSLENPFVYFTTNTLGNLNLLELCREFGVNKYILASTSSLYAGQKMPFKEDLPVNEPISPYAASKKAAEVTCYTYHNLYDIDVTILRYFTVYGPAARPDMSPLRFISWVYQEKPVIIYGDGSQSRDFTYVDDIARGTILGLKPLGFEIINLGGDKPVKLLDFLRMIEDKIDKKAKIVHEPSHPADMEATWADIKKAKELLAWQPSDTLEHGLEKSIQWFTDNLSFSAKIPLV
jgi:UDP-glucuronate 4-epimerase